ncbi:hypothetical protein KYY02_13805 [Streptomyces pimonensis]|uniref:Uncharacterized protein n=1 Tax=Streptomyces pimonensis TaxID=2860288 RepID=A0ABV4IYF4_9ACTN
MPSNEEPGLGQVAGGGVEGVLLRDRVRERPRSRAARPRRGHLTHVTTEAERGAHGVVRVGR